MAQGSRRWTASPPSFVWRSSACSGQDDRGVLRATRRSEPVALALSSSCKEGPFLRGADTSLSQCSTVLPALALCLLIHWVSPPFLCTIYVRLSTQNDDG